jgi:outer membrane protein
MEEFTGMILYKKINILRKKCNLFFITALFIPFISCYAQGSNDSGKINNSGDYITLEKCINLALENNHRVNISQQNIKIAEYQLKQVKSALYPRLSLSANISFFDEDLMFIMPGQSVFLDIPPITGIKFDEIRTPPVEAKIMDSRNIHTGLSLVYPLFTGGKLSALNQQAKNNVEIARYDANKEDLEIVFEVKNYFYSYCLCKKLLDLCNETVEMLDATLSLTEGLYLNGSGRVTRLDYLKNKVFADQVKSMLSEFEKNYNQAREALIFITGNNISQDFILSSYEIPFQPVTTGYNEVLDNVYQNNPDWSKINSAMEVYKAKSAEANSSLFPSIGLFANFDANFNEFEFGLVNKYNKYIWTMGIGMEYELFSGLKTSAEIDEAEAGLSKINEEKLLLKSALELQVKNLFHELSANAISISRLAESKTTSVENRNLTERAFQQEMSDADEVVQAQIMESLVNAQYIRALYNYAISRAKLELITGQKF